MQRKSTDWFLDDGGIGRERVKEKEFYPSEYMSGLAKFKEELPGNEKFHGSLTNKRISDKEYENVLKVYDRVENNER